MKSDNSLFWVFALGLLWSIAGCSGSGGGGGGSSGGSGISVGNLIGGKAGGLFDAGTTALSAETISDVEEDQMGRTVAIAATNRWPLFDKPELTKYVTLVGLTVADATSKPDGWVFGVVDTPDLGAYSGPNGYVLITRGAIAAMEDESELAGVLAHEIAHVVDHDGLEAIKTGRRLEAISKGLSAADQRAAAFNQLSGNLIEKILNSGYSQGQESKADSKAVKLLIATGYDPNGLIKFLKRLEARKGGSAKLFSTHPGTADRIARLTVQTSSAKTGATNKERFAKAAAEAKL
jgi:predicted Zn-dependent protease